MHSSNEPTLMGRVLRVIANDYSDDRIERWINFNQHDWTHYRDDGTSVMQSEMPDYIYEDYEQ